MTKSITDDHETALFSITLKNGEVLHSHLSVRLATHSNRQLHNVPAELLPHALTTGNGHNLKKEEQAKKRMVFKDHQKEK